MSQALQTYAVTSHDGDTLDCIVTRHNCTVDQNTIMTINPQLINLPAILPRNTTVNLPYNLTTHHTIRHRETVNLWS